MERVIPDAEWAAEVWTSAQEEARLRDYKGATCDDCERFTACTCGCGWGWCEENGGFADGDDKACDPDIFRRKS